MSTTICYLIGVIEKMSKVNLTYLQDGSVGAIAQESIEAGLVVENCPILKLDWPSKYHNDPSVVNFSFSIPCSTPECQKHGTTLFFPLGWGLLYKQSNDPNCNVYLSEDLSTMIVQANRDVAAGSLLTINKNSITPVSNNSNVSQQNSQDFSEKDLEDDEFFMRKMSGLLSSQDQ